jgi:predicted XRE-type DNA-binding protein
MAKRTKPPEVPAVDTITTGTWNVFRDLDCPDPDLSLMKTDLVRRLGDAIRARRLPKARAAEMAGLKGPEDLAKVLEGSLKRVSVDRLVGMLNGVGYVVEAKFEARPLKGEPKPVTRKAAD